MKGKLEKFYTTTNGEVVTIYRTTNGLYIPFTAIDTVKIIDGQIWAKEMCNIPDALVFDTPEAAKAKLMERHRGGKREGAGRPSKDYKALSVRVPAEIAETIKQMAQEREISQGEVITEIVREYSRSEI